MSVPCLEILFLARFIALGLTNMCQVFQLTTDVTGLQNAITGGKIASMLGVEGSVLTLRHSMAASHFDGSYCSAHQLGNSLGVLRTYQTLGVRYVTLTHTCNNAFADAAGTSKSKHDGLRWDSPLFTQFFALCFSLMPVIIQQPSWGDPRARTKQARDASRPLAYR